jgi:hypothetical protein
MDLPRKPDADMCAKFLRAHSVYLNTGKAVWPYTDSARAISNVNDAAADLLDGSGCVIQAKRNSKIEIALLGIVGRWEQNGGVVEEEFINRARDALST